MFTQTKCARVAFIQTYSMCRQGDKHVLTPEHRHIRSLHLHRAVRPNLGTEGQEPRTDRCVHTST